MTDNDDLLFPLGEPVIVQTGDVWRRGFYAGRCGVGGCRHKVTARKRGSAGWCVDANRIRRAPKN